MCLSLAFRPGHILSWLWTGAAYGDGRTNSRLHVLSRPLLWDGLLLAGDKAIPGRLEHEGAANQPGDHGGNHLDYRHRDDACWSSRHGLVGCLTCCVRWLRPVIGGTSIPWCDSE